eukprot:gene39026-52728_t
MGSGSSVNSLPQGSKIAMKAIMNGRYLSATAGGLVNCNGQVIEAPQIWEVNYDSENRISLKSSTQFYLSCNGNNVTTSAKVVSEYERFVTILDSAGNASLKFLESNAFLKVNDDGAVTSNPTFFGITTKECFKVEQLGFGQQPQPGYGQPAVNGQHQPGYQPGYGQPGHVQHPQPVYGQQPQPGYGQP